MVLIQPKMSSTRFRFLTDGVSKVLRGSLIESAAASFVPALRYVRSHRRFPELVHKSSRVVVLVSPLSSLAVFRLESAPPSPAPHPTRPFLWPA
jgi:hypothetical protein